MFLLGNHDLKLARALAGTPVRRDALLDATLAQLDPGLAARALQEIAAAPAWLRQGNRLFIHGGFHSDMLDNPAPRVALERPRGAALIPPRPWTAALPRLPS